MTGPSHSRDRPYRPSPLFHPSPSPLPNHPPQGGGILHSAQIHHHLHQHHYHLQPQPFSFSPRTTPPQQQAPPTTQPQHQPQHRPFAPSSTLIPAHSLPRHPSPSDSPPPTLQQHPTSPPSPSPPPPCPHSHNTTAYYSCQAGSQSQSRRRPCRPAGRATRFRPLCLTSR